jgi:hypothetical protein
MAKFADHMQKISGDVVTGYKKIEKGVVGAYRKEEDAFVNTFMAKEGESVQDAKARVAADTEARNAAQKAMVQKNLEASRNAGKRK